MKKLLTWALALTLAATPISATALAQSKPTPLQDMLSINQPEPANPVFIKPPVKPAKEAEPVKPVEPPKPQPIEYVVVAGDNLTKIGTAHQVEWQRLWSKNLNIKHPDVIHIGDKLTIPVADEVIAARELPAAVALPVVTPGASAPSNSPVQNPVQSVGNYGGGNTYSPGYCTWYVKNRRGSSLPNMLGNANQWFANAQAMGMATGYTPRAGAVGTTTRGSLGHVVYVEAVNGDGSITISEMNYAGLYSQRTRTAAASEFSYIY